LAIEKDDQLSVTVQKRKGVSPFVAREKGGMGTKGKKKRRKGKGRRGGPFPREKASMSNRRYRKKKKNSRPARREAGKKEGVKNCRDRLSWATSLPRLSSRKPAPDSEKKKTKKRRRELWRGGYSQGGK